MPRRLKCWHCGHEITPGENDVPQDWPSAVDFMLEHIREKHQEMQLIEHGGSDVTYVKLAYK